MMAKNGFEQMATGEPMPFFTSYDGNVCFHDVGPRLSMPSHDGRMWIFKNGFWP